MSACPALPSTPASHRSPAAAWNNLGDAYEKQKKYGDALSAYKEVLTYAPDNKVRPLKGVHGGWRARGFMEVLTYAPDDKAHWGGDGAWADGWWAHAVQGGAYVAHIYCAAGLRPQRPAMLCWRLRTNVLTNGNHPT